LDDRAGVCDNDGMSDDRHHQGNVCAVGCLQQLRSGEGDDVSDGVIHVLSADDSNGFLLLQNCLQDQKQGNLVLKSAQYYDFAISARYNVETRQRCIQRITFAAETKSGVLSIHDISGSADTRTRTA